MNWLTKISAYEDTYELRRDGRLKFRGTENECYRKLQQSQSQSFDWAMKYEGWTITQSGTDWQDAYQWYGGENEEGKGSPQIKEKIEPKMREKVELDIIKLFCGFCGFKTTISKEELEKLDNIYPRCYSCNNLQLSPAYVYKCPSCGDIEQIAAIDYEDVPQCKKCGDTMEDIS